MAAPLPAPEVLKLLTPGVVTCFQLQPRATLEIVGCPTRNIMANVVADHPAAANSRIRETSTSVNLLRGWASPLQEVPHLIESAALSEGVPYARLLTVLLYLSQSR